MGLILDSSVLISAERKGLNARQALSEIARSFPGEDIALSVMTVAELMHGAVQAHSPQRKSMRPQFINELISAVPIHPVTTAVALRAGQIDGENAAKGIRLSLADLLVGVTALELGYRVATGNLRHCQMVPELATVLV